MFRAAFHTGYVPCGVLRFTRDQLDGACTDKRFDEDFFIDFIFAPLESPPIAGPNIKSDTPQNTASIRRERGLVIDAESKDAYDAMLHRDLRFWEEITKRKEINREKAKARKAANEKKLIEKRQKQGK